ncbi:MAG: carbohydrate-binding domain-containing protein [Ruminococcaceae bacterium]|nr:carbohydrate-binding domain-containing protein [Oscillospiraceae bacterium]
MNCNKTIIFLAAAALTLCLFGGCSHSEETVSPDAPITSAPPTVEGLDTSDLFYGETPQTPTGNSATPAPEKPTATTIKATGNGVTVKDNLVTITQGGTVTLQGDMTDGQILVNVSGNVPVTIILQGVNVHCSTGAALYVAQAAKVTLTLAKDSHNQLASTGTFPTTGENGNSPPDGALFSRDDLTLNGAGSLTVSSIGHGIVCKDTLAITGGTYAVTATGHAIQGKDDVRIAGGRFTLQAGKDGIHVENSDDATQGFLYIADGIYTVTADGDGFSASGKLQLDGGTGTLTTGGGAATASATGKHGAWGAYSTQSSNDDTSAKGIKAGDNLLIAGGAWQVNAADDAVHTNASASISGGTLTLATGDDGVHADTALVITGGKITVTTSCEGLEATTIEVRGGNIDLTTTDDGLNAAGGNDQSGLGADRFNTDTAARYIRITGGVLHINAAGDGVDANGSIYVTGGETYVSGPTNSGNGALDYDREAVISGGTFVATGASGMATGFTSAQNQGAMFVNLSSSGTDTLVLKDSNGKTLLSYTPKKAYSSVVLSCPSLQKGNTYTLTAAGQATSITLSELLYSNGGMGGGPGGMGGLPPGSGRPGR